MDNPQNGTSNAETIKVRLVLKDRGWILEKFAMRLAENLPLYKVIADISALSVSVSGHQSLDVVLRY